jgi:hypothetical protein
MNGKTTWIIVIVSLVSFFLGVGAWVARTWMQVQQSAEYISTDSARNVQIDLWLQQQDKVIGKLQASQCILFRLVNDEREQNHMRLIVEPVECR